MHWDLWFGYVVTALLFSLSPGSGAVNSISNGIQYGFRLSLLSIFGLQLGLCFHLLLVSCGLGTLVFDYPTVFSLVKWLGVGYLLWLGWCKWHDSRSFHSQDTLYSANKYRLFFQGIMVNVTNPKTIVFLVALFPQFLDPTISYTEQLIVLSATTLFIDASVMVMYVALAAQCAPWLNSGKQVTRLNRLFGTLFVGCGILLALSSQ